MPLPPSMPAFRLPQPGKLSASPTDPRPRSVVSFVPPRSVVGDEDLKTEDR